jgi:hypothetical protein
MPIFKPDEVVFEKLFTLLITSTNLEKFKLGLISISIADFFNLNPTPPQKLTVMFPLVFMGCEVVAPVDELIILLLVIEFSVKITFTD